MLAATFRSPAPQLPALQLVNGLVNQFELPLVRIFHPSCLQPRHCMTMSQAVQACALLHRYASCHVQSPPTLRPRWQYVTPL